MSGYRDAMRNYANFRGRTSHRDFLQAQLLFVPIIALAFGEFGLPIPGRGAGMGGSISIWPIAFYVFIVLPHVVPWAALMVRRLHDMNRSGLWALLALIPVGFIVPFPLACLVLWGLLPGTPGPNRFGADPLGREPQTAAPAMATAGVPPQPTTASPPRDVIAEIERLAQLRANGSLSDAEFEVMKARALGSNATA